MTINGRTAAHVAALRRTLEYVLTHPDEHEQDAWGTAYDLRVPSERRAAPACRTAYCFAGHAAVTIAGARPVWEGCYRDADGREVPVGDLFEVVPPGADPADEDEHVSVQEYAARYLGLRGSEPMRLFAGSNTLSELAHLVYAFTAGDVDLRTQAVEVERARRPEIADLIEADEHL